MDFETKKVIVKMDDGKEVDILLNLWDFGGEKKFRILFPSYVSGASGALLLYDITNKDSLADLDDWIKLIDSVRNPPRTKILCEHKIDLEDQREVSREEAMEVFKRYKISGELLGTSAKTGQNVERAFESLGEEILKNSLVKCSNCGIHYPIELKFCQYCGAKKF